MKTDYATVSWTVEDMQTLQPKWSDEKCHNFLQLHEDYIVDRIIEENWSVINDMAENWMENREIFEPLDTYFDDLDMWSKEDCKRYLENLKRKIIALREGTNYEIDNAVEETSLTKEFILFSHYTNSEHNVQIELHGAEYESKS